MEERAALPITIKLEEPVEYGAETLYEVTIAHRPKVKDLKGLRVDHDSLCEIDNITLAVSRILNLPKPIVEQFTVPDLFVLWETISPFFTPSQSTSTK